MRYQLVTTLGPQKNVGDAFIRIGAENRIKATDPKAEFVLTCKETDPVLEDCDARIWCGMPLAWERCEEIPWWPFLKEFSAQPNAQIWGAGSCVGPKFDADRLRKTMEDVKCYATSRDMVLSDLMGWKLERCPAFDCIKDSEPATLNLCNWQLNGGHFPHMNEKEAGVWSRHGNEIIKRIAPPSEGWVYVAHDQAEVDYAKRLGYSDIRSGTAQDLLKVYAKAKAYRGNRVHGAIATRSGGCNDVMCIGWESRMFSVSRPAEPKMWFYPSELV